MHWAAKCAHTVFWELPIQLWCRQKKKFSMHKTIKNMHHIFILLRNIFSSKEEEISSSKKLLYKKRFKKFKRSESRNWIVENTLDKMYVYQCRHENQNGNTLDLHLNVCKVLFKKMFCVYPFQMRTQNILLPNFIVIKMLQYNYIVEHHGRVNAKWFSASQHRKY